MKKVCLFLALVLAAMTLLSACDSNKEQEVTCTMCNGSGQVKYYYGDGDNDYNMGPCTSCDEQGTVTVTPSGSADAGSKVVCGSCGEYVDKLITQKDAAGENRTWCAGCWDDYNAIMG